LAKPITWISTITIGEINIPTFKELVKMKHKNIIVSFFSSTMLLLIVVLIGCQDEVIVKVEDTTQVDELLAEISNYTNQYLTLDEKNGTLHIENEKLWRKLDSLEQVRNKLANPYSTPEELQFTLNILSSANTVFSGGRSKGLSGATVTLEQNGLVVSADPSSSDGLYLFRGLREGSAFVKVTAPDHTPVEFYVGLVIANGDDISDADSYNASTQVILFPNGGSAAGKITGKAYANTSTLNDTLGYRYGGSGLFGAKANTYISTPGSWRYGNFTQVDQYIETASIYSPPGGENIQWETATAGHIIYCIPEFNNYEINNESENGFIYSITYRNVITKATIAADGSFTLPVLAGNTYDDNTLVQYVTLTTEDMIASHTRLTKLTAYAGAITETGAVDQAFSYFNSTDAAQNVFTGNGTVTANVNAGAKLAITRRKITETWAYRMRVPNDQFGLNDESEIHPQNQAYPQAGETKYRNVYFFPVSKR
jgi:hypothetical protein